MFHGVIQKLKLAQFFFETRCRYRNTIANYLSLSQRSAAVVETGLKFDANGSVDQNALSISSIGRDSRASRIISYSAVAKAVTFAEILRSGAKCIFREYMTTDCVRVCRVRCMMGGNLSIIRHQESLPPVTDSDDVDDTSLTLTDQQRQLIVSTWKQLSACSDSSVEEEVGVRIFIRIFELNPTIREAFPIFDELQNHEAMRRNVVFRCHGRRFVRAVRSVVDHLDDLDVIAVPNLDLLGRKHQEFHGFRADYLRTYEAAMEDIWGERLGRRYDKTARHAWHKVFRLITSSVLRGYEQKVICPAATVTAAQTAQKTTAAMPNDINGSLACNDSQADCSLSS